MSVASVKYQWDWLVELVNRCPIKGISVIPNVAQTAWLVDENYYSHERQANFKTFSFVRNMDGTRFTRLATSNFVGLVSVNQNIRNVVVTEGVSDFLTVKAYYPYLNVLGKLNTSISRSDIQLLQTLFDLFVYIPDSDHTGRSAAMNFRRSLSPYKVHIANFNSGYKDVTAMALYSPDDIFHNYMSQIVKILC